MRPLWNKFRLLCANDDEEEEEEERAEKRRHKAERAGERERDFVGTVFVTVLESTSPDECLGESTSMAGSFYSYSSELLRLRLAGRGFVT